jgi:hypothetical protein
MMPTKEAIEGYLETNSSWTTGWPVIPNTAWQECEKAWKVQKILILRKIMKDMAILFAEDDEFASEVFFQLRNNLSTAFWQAKCGVFPIWMGMYSRAKGVARKKLGGSTDLDTLSKGLLKNGKVPETNGAFTKPR